MDRTQRALWILTALAMAACSLGCKGPPPTNPGVIAREPNHLLWGDTQLPAGESPKPDRPLDFAVVAGRADSGVDGTAKKAWLETIEAAKADNDTCVFTSFIGWEARSTHDGHSLDRVVFMNGGPEQASQFTPFSSADRSSPKDLQAWLEETRHRVGTDFITIPYQDGALAPAPSNEVSFQGMAAVWAEENTRTSIFAAFKRKEVYATTGPRIRVRFFGGWGFSATNAKTAGMVKTGYTLGHPMGGHLTKAPEDKAPGFLMYAVKDPKGANLDRIQIVKGWIDAEGTAHEKVYDAVLPTVDEPKKKKKKKKAPPVTSSVEPGAPALSGFWSDPHFDPKEAAFYYMRALEVSTRKKEPQPPSVPGEHAYTSPIWYTP